MGRDGYQAVRWMRERGKEKRGGNTKFDDGLTRQGQTLAALSDEYLEHLRIINRTPAAIQTRQCELKAFLMPIRLTPNHTTSCR